MGDNATVMERQRIQISNIIAKAWAIQLGLFSNPIISRTILWKNQYIPTTIIIRSRRAKIPPIATIIFIISIYLAPLPPSI